MVEDNLKKLIYKNLEETEIGRDLVVYSQRTAFVYGADDDLKDKKYLPIEEFLINILNKQGPIARSELASLTKIPRTTLYDVLARLISKGLVEKKPVHIQKRGRPKVLFYVKN